MPRKIEISHRTIVFTALFVIALAFLYFIRDILLQVFVALLIAMILNPLVARLTRFRIPRTLAAVFVYFLFVGVFVGSIAGLVPAMIDQTTSFASSLPRYLENAQLPFGLNKEVVNQFSGHLANLPEQTVGFLVSAFSNVLTIFTIIIISFYMLLGWTNFDKQLAEIFGEKRGDDIRDMLQLLEIKLGSWARGQLLLMVMVGLSTYVGLVIVGIPYAIALGILAAILEIIPILGPFMAAIPAVIVGFSISPLTGVAVAALAFLVQQLENYVFVPNIMKKSTGLSPVITLIALVVGFKVAGVAGALLSLPTVITLQTILHPYFSKE
jgi:predicted PurR-regulated permease PerM